MTVSPNWRVGFELELVLGDLFDPRFEEYLSDPMDEASHAYCKTVAAELAEVTGARWLAARKKQRNNGYFVYPEYDLDPLNWPSGLVAGVEIVTPPLVLAEAEALRKKIRAWVYGVDGDINTYPNAVSSCSGWHINIDPGHAHRSIDDAKILAAADELPMLMSAGRYPSKYAAPQRHSYGAPLLRYIRSKGGRSLLDIEFGNFLRHHAGRGKRYAMNFDKLDSGYLELRHFGSEWFFREQPLDDILSPIFQACEATHHSVHEHERQILGMFEILSGWLDGIMPSLSSGWDKRGGIATNMAFGAIYFEGQPLANVRWSGTADYALQLRGEEDGPAIRDQAYPDLPLSLAILALDVAEIRARKLGKVPLLNKGFSKAIDQLAKALTRAGLADPLPLEQSVFWTDGTWDEARVCDETGLGELPGTEGKLDTGIHADP